MADLSLQADSACANRRAFLKAVPVAIAATALPSAAMAATGDGALHAAWARYVASRADLDALPDVADTYDEQAEIEAPYWAVCDEAEATIHRTTAVTPAGAAIKIKVALAHMLTTRTHDNALRAGDIGALAAADLDWAERVLVSALVSLTTMEA